MLTPIAAVAMLQSDQIRSNSIPEQGRRVAPSSIVTGDMLIDIPRRLVEIAGEAVALKSREFELLLYFMRHPGIVLSRDALLREVRSYDYPVDTRTVDVHVRWLRQKIEIDASAPLRIVTVRGHGYRFVPIDAA